MNVKIPNIPTYILNIPARKERLKNALLQVEKLGVNAEIFHAYTPVMLDVPYEELEKPLHKINRFTPGCFAARDSFVAILNDAVATKKPCFLYVEDDVFIVDGAKEQLEQMLAELPDNWDVLLLSVYHYQKPDIVSESLVKVNGTWGMNLALFNESSYERLSNLVSTGFRPADLTVGMTKLLGSDINVYAARHNISYETPDMVSDITHKAETKELPIDVMTHQEITPIEIALAKNPNLNFSFCSMGNFSYSK